MAITVDRLINDERFCGDSVLQFLAFLPIGLCLLIVRICLALVLWIAAIILPDKSAVRQMLSVLACWTFGVFVKTKGSRDPRCSVLVANYVSCLDSLAASHALGTISLRKWKVPPFFASTLGIRNAAQFVRKQHFTDSPSKPVLLQPEGGPTNGKGLLKFTDWPFPAPNRVQPVAISVERMFTNVTVHSRSRPVDRFPWWDALWFLCSPWTVYRLTLLPAHCGPEHTEHCRRAIADNLHIELTELSWPSLPARPPRSPPVELVRLANLVKEVLPRVPARDIMRDLAVTRSVDATITNFLEGAIRYEPEPEPQPGPSSSQPRYVTPVPTGVFPRSAAERQLSFQEKKTQMIAEARARYIQKHGLRC